MESEARLDWQPVCCEHIEAEGLQKLAALFRVIRLI
jgi:hypothetical protein